MIGDRLIGVLFSFIENTSKYYFKAIKNKSVAGWTTHIRFGTIYYMHKNRYIDNCGVLRGVSDGVKKSKVHILRPSERGQLAEVSLRRSEGQTLCLQLAAEKRLVRIPNRRKTMGALLLRLFWHVVAGEARRGPMTLPQAAIAPPYQPDRPPRAFSR